MVLGTWFLPAPPPPEPDPACLISRFELLDFLACGDHVGMLVGVFQPQRVEIAAQLLEAALHPGSAQRPPVTITCGARSTLSICGTEAISLRSESRLVDRVFECVLGLDHRVARLVEPAVGCRSRRPAHPGARSETTSGILPRQFCPALLGGAQLIAVGGDLVVEKALRAVHLGAAAACRLLGEDRQQRLHHVFGRLRIFVAIADGHQVGGDRA